MNTTEVTLWMIHETALARLYSTKPKIENPDEQGVWIPRAHIKQTTKHLAKSGQWPLHIVTLPDWIVNAHKL
jgi:hypothetical protein